MIIMLQGIRTGRVQALKALRTLDHWHPDADEDDQGAFGISFKPGLKEALDMVNAMPTKIRIYPAHLPEFEKDFYVQVVSNPPSDYIQPGDCVAGPDMSHYQMPWAAIYFPGGVLSIGGGVRDLADTIHRLLEDGHPEDKITIELLGGGPTRLPCWSGPIA